MKSLKGLLCVLILLVTSCDNNPQPGNKFNSLEEEVDFIAGKYVKVGAIVGIINKQQQKLVFSYGSKSIDQNNPPDANTTFDIGSITKTFTAILAASMYSKGIIQDDIVQHYLPSTEITLPKKDNIDITFLHLLSHTSGIPRTPHESGSLYPLPQGYDIENPYATYTTAQVYDYLTNYCTLEFTPGTWWEYSNTGVGLLGHVLGLIDNTSYQTILTRDIFDVLAMNNSSLFLRQDQQLNLAQGHDSNNKKTPFFTANDIFQGAGMIKSTLSDMMIYLEANMGLINTPLRDAMDLTYKKVMHQGSMGDQGMAWWILELDDGQKIIYSGGNTNGHSSYIAFNQTESTGVVILLNSSNHNGANLDMGVEIMKAITKY